jgi:hypothetical protein
MKIPHFAGRKFPDTEAHKAAASPLAPVLGLAPVRLSVALSTDSFRLDTLGSMEIVNLFQDSNSPITRPYFDRMPNLHQRLDGSTS